MRVIAYMYAHMHSGAFMLVHVLSLCYTVYVTVEFIVYVIVHGLELVTSKKFLCCFAGFLSSLGHFG